MKNIVKEFLKSSVISIGMSLTIFCIICVGFDIGFHGNFSLVGYQMTKMIVGCVLVGLGFGLPTIVYQNDSIPMPVRVIIHMGIGCAIYTTVAFAVGWIGGVASIGQGLIIGAIMLGIAFLIWYFFMRFYRAEARKMNERIQEMK